MKVGDKVYYKGREMDVIDIDDLSNTGEVAVCQWIEKGKQRADIFLVEDLTDGKRMANTNRQQFEF